MNEKEGATRVHLLGQSHKSDMAFEIFHENTKYFPRSFEEKLPDIMGHLFDKRRIYQNSRNYKRYSFAETIELPEPDRIDMSLSDSLQNRKSVREFTPSTLTLQMLSTILYHSAGVNRKERNGIEKKAIFHLRTYPSAGALYPIEIYPVLVRTDGSNPCVTHYNPINHNLSIVRKEYDIAHLMEAIGDQFDKRSPSCSVVLLLTSVFQRVTEKYQDRGYRFALMEAGFISENISLVSVGLGLGSLMLGGCMDNLVNEIIKVDGVNETFVNCLLIGHDSPHGKRKE